MDDDDEDRVEDGDEDGDDEDCDSRHSGTTGLGGTTNKRARFDPTLVETTRPLPAPMRLAPMRPAPSSPPEFPDWMTGVDPETFSGKIDGMARALESDGRSRVRSIQGENYALSEGMKTTAEYLRMLLRRFAQERVRHDEDRARHAQDREKLQADIAVLRRQVDEAARRGVVRDMTVEEKAAIDEGLRDVTAGFDAAMAVLDSATFDALCAFDPLDQFTRRFGDINLGGSRQK